VEDEPHLTGGRVMARHAVREELRLVQFDQVLNLPALAIEHSRKDVAQCLRAR
jgi:hypothetical protein